MADFEIFRNCELTKPPQTHSLAGTFFTEDNIGQRLGFHILKYGTPETITGTVSGLCVRADGVTVPITGAASNNDVYVDLPEESLAINGPCALSIRVANNGKKTVLGRFTYSVAITSTDSIINPGNVIPSIEELIQILVDIDATAELIEGMTVSASAVSGETPTVTKTTVDGHYNLAFGLVPARITNTVTHYQNSTSGTTIPSGTWLNAQPSTPQGQFLWTRITYTWNNSEPTYQYSVSRQGIDGEGAVNTVNGLSPDANGNIDLPTDSAPTSGSTNYVTSGGVKAAIDSVSDVAAVKANEDIIGIVETGETATHNIEEGQYVIWKGALYTASAAIASGTALSSANLAAVQNGGLNAVVEPVDISSEFTTTSYIIANSFFAYKIGKLIYIGFRMRNAADQTNVLTIPAKYSPPGRIAGSCFYLHNADFGAEPTIQAYNLNISYRGTKAISGANGIVCTIMWPLV